MLLRGAAISFLTGFIFLGCTTSTSDDSADGTVSPTMQGPPEATYCATPTTFSPSVTISGTAQYIRREHFGSVMDAPGSAGLGSAVTAATDPNPTTNPHPATANPIRYAEVMVKNSSGVIIQCGETQVDGTFSVVLPQGNQAYTIFVNSRSLNSHLHASILNGPDSNTFYSLTTTVPALVSTSVGTITAPANGTILGGAFNILDQILNANIYLVAQVGACSSSFTGCANYDPTLHKIDAYWKPGFNPNDYFGPGGGGLSFYLPGYSRLFILGGVDGDTDSSDTDHFDNSIIIHEYGHFLEDNWLKTDSPGGPHDGDEILDPRLAWSEGWGDFIQAAVRGDNHYVDSMGNTDGATEMIFYVDTETVTSGGFDYTTNLGEGNFREFSVTRMLWDAIDGASASTADPAADSDTFTDNGTATVYQDVVFNGFKEIWAVLSKATRGYRDPSFAFRNVGLFHLAQVWMQNNKAGAGDQFAQDWTSIRGLNRHQPNTSHYGQALIPSATPLGGGGSCANTGAGPSFTPTGGSTNYFFQVVPKAISGDDGSLSNSDLFSNNRFYHLHIGASPFAAGGTHTLVLNYQDDDGVGTLADLDLYLYNSSARFATTTDMIAMSRATPSGAVTTTQTETVSASLGAGDYLINVNVYTGGSLGGTADFNLVLDGVVLCPYDLVR